MSVEKCVHLYIILKITEISVSILQLVINPENIITIFSGPNMTCTVLELLSFFYSSSLSKKSQSETESLSTKLLVSASV